MNFFLVPIKVADATYRLSMQAMGLLKNIIYYFILTALDLHCYGLPLTVARGVHSSLQCWGFSLQWLLLLWSTGSELGLSGCGSWALQRGLSSRGAWA